PPRPRLLGPAGPPPRPGRGHRAPLALVSLREPQQDALCECGADRAACEAAWGDCLQREFTDPAYGAVHHLTVAAYHVQHGSRLSCEGWHVVREQLRRFVDGVTPEEAREAW